MKDYVNEINKMADLYFSNKFDNILLLVNKKSFDKNLNGDFNLNNNLISKSDNNDFIYIGCQILNRKSYLKNLKLDNFSIKEIWDQLLKNNRLNGFESSNKFFHLTNLETFKKLKDL